VEVGQQQREEPVVCHAAQAALWGRVAVAGRGSAAGECALRTRRSREGCSGRACRDRLYWRYGGSREGEVASPNVPRMKRTVYRRRTECSSTGKGIRLPVSERLNACPSNQTVKTTGMREMSRAAGSSKKRSVWCAGARSAGKTRR